MLQHKCRVFALKISSMYGNPELLVSLAERLWNRGAQSHSRSFCDFCFPDFSSHLWTPNVYRNAALAVQTQQQGCSKLFRPPTTSDCGYRCTNAEATTGSGSHARAVWCATLAKQSSSPGLGKKSVAQPGHIQGTSRSHPGHIQVTSRSCK